MQTIIHKKRRFSKADHLIFLVKNPAELDQKFFSADELKYIRTFRKEHEQMSFHFNRYQRWVLVQFIKMERKANLKLEALRKAGNTLLSSINKNKLNQVFVLGGSISEQLALAEGMALGNYQFTKYKSEKNKKVNSLNDIYLSADVAEDQLTEVNILVDAVTHCRNLVNEPVIHLDAVKLAKSISALAGDAGIKTDVFNKKKIESLKMGGLLAVNKGSVDPPTFTILEWKPGKVVNEKPIVLVGKGVVYDTGGMNIKTGTYMEDMKMDMAGAATAATTIYAIAKAELPVHVIALIPATDNRVTGNAYVSGDVIKMYDGSTVEVINTDAEGRMIMADALSYAKKYQPELVIDMATLTGAAARAIGHFGLVAMESSAGRYMKRLKTSGENVYEPVAEFPFWDEYTELIKSDIADIKNIGGSFAGAITAGKFLEHFTDYPYIHLDIAGPAYVNKPFKYFGTGATAFGVRLLYDFIKGFVKN